MRRYLVGVDLSEPSEAGMAHAVALARTTGAEVVLVLAGMIPSPPEGLPAAAAATSETYLRILRERLAADRAELGALRDRWSGQGVVLSQIVVDGHADEQLPRIAAEHDAELIIVGSHGRTGIKRFLIGSIAERVVRLAHCSVLVARGPAPPAGYRRVVVGTDFSSHADVALRRAIEIAPRDARIDVVHCWQMPAVLTPPDAPAMVPTYDQVRRDIEAELGRAGHALIAGLPGDRDVRFHLLEHAAARGLDDHARAVGAELVVVGSHGRRGLRRVVLGSVAEVTVRHAPCAALVAR